MEPAYVAERTAWLDRTYPTWERHTLSGRLDLAAQRWPDRPYVVTAERSWTYAEMAAWSVRLARGLVALGLRPRQHVAIILNNYPEMAALQFAVARAGAVAVPLNSRLRHTDLAYALNQSDAVMLVTMDRFRDLDYLGTLSELAPELMAGGLSPDFPYLRRVLVHPTGVGDFPARGGAGLPTLSDVAALEPDATVWSAVAGRTAYPDEVATLLYTSGTTSTPKGALLTHDMHWRSALGSCYNRAIPEGVRIFCPLPLYHVFGLVEALFVALLMGGAVVLQPAFNAAEAVDIIEACGPDDFLAVPSLILELLKQDLSGRDLSSLRAMYCAGQAVNPNLWRRIQDELGIRELNTGYGMTEVTSGVMQTPPGSPLSVIETRVGRVLPGGAAGLPEFGGNLIEYKVVDSLTGEDLPPGSEGEWACRGPIVIRGYYRKPEETAAAIDKDGWFRTGDVGIIHPDGLFQITGRSKDMYRVGGENVNPGEVEHCVNSIPAVLNTVAVGVPDPQLGEVGMVFVELRPGESLSVPDVIDYCRARLARFKVPKYVQFVKSGDLPRSSSDKVQKFKLSEWAVRELGLQMPGGVEAKR